MSAAFVCPQIGAFYECVGYDAAMLMEYASLNPMGGVRSEVPRAGCPEKQIHDVLKQLTEHAGLSVVSVGLLCWRCRAAGGFDCTRPLIQGLPQGP